MKLLPPLRSRRTLYFALVVVAVGLLLLVDWLAEYLWFATLGFTEVFWLPRLLKLGLFVFGFSVVALYCWINGRLLAARLDVAATTGALAKRLRNSLQAPAVSGKTTVMVPSTLGLVLAIVLLGALVCGLFFASQWDVLLRFLWAQTYGEADPLFARDIGFYLFRLPFLELLQNTVTVFALVATLGLILIYAEAGFIRAGAGGVRFDPQVRRHIMANLALLLLAQAWGYYLERYALLQSADGAVYGAGYTDVYVLRPSLWMAIGVSLGLALLVLSPQLLQRLRWVIAALAGYLALMFVALAILPWAVQSFVVEPNELELEQPFLSHNIALTREAYGLSDVQERYYDALDGLTPAVLSRNRQTLDNIRLWDWRPLSQTFRQLQQIRSYYAVGDVDVDRYQFGDDYRQVMLAARELANELPGKADTWVNRYLQYTHGYGLAMSLTAAKDAQGSPILVVKDLPPQTVAGLVIAEPAIYYGENMKGYRIVATAVKELDFPRGDDNVYTRYRGRGGVLLDSFWKRLLFAWHQFDANILISSYVEADSRIQLWRRVRERVERIAPFLRLDDDPYPVISNGSLYWIQDAYTLSDMFPYAEPYEGRFNYIRNSVKVVVDAYEGSVRFYVIDPNDAVLQVYRKALPTLFTDLVAMPEDLRRHLRYPVDLFAVQAAKFSTYHMTVPQVFYNSEDIWAAPREKYGGEVIAMKPYYVLMKLPQEEQLEFLLMTPLTPNKRDNMIAWMAARCDFPDYGQLIVYKLPKMRLILGPIQVEAMIDQDTLISQQLSLWDQRGSRVIRGNLLVIPIDHSFIYVEPVYLIAEDTDIPQLKRVIVSDGERLAMEPTLEEALNVVFGGVSRAMPQESGERRSGNIDAARAALAAAEKALREADWNGFGRAMEKLKEMLGE